MEFTKIEKNRSLIIKIPVLFYLTSPVLIATPAIIIVTRINTTPFF